MKNSFKYLATFVLVGFMVIVLPGCGSGVDNGGNVNIEKSGKSASIKDILGMGKSQKCTWTGEDGESGVIYTDGKKSRVEVSGALVEKGQKMISLNDGEWTYTWIDGADTQGTKIKLADLEEMNDQFGGDFIEDDEDSEIDEDMPGDYSCENWRARGSMFDPPSDVEFMDMNSQLEGLGDMMDSMKDVDAESVCGFVPESERQDCLDDLNSL